MDPTPEFTKFTAGFHQDIFDLHEDDDEILETALNALSQQEQQRLREFLKSIVQSPLSDEELQDLWNTSAADFYIADPDQVRSLYQSIIDLIPPG